MIAGVIFLIGIVILYNYAINYSTQSKNNLDELLYEGNLASGLLLSEENFGIIANGKINQTKLETFNSLTTAEKKNSLGVRNNFYFTIENLEINGNPQTYVGAMNTTQIDNLIRITRISVYKNKPTKFQLFAWSS